MSAAAAGRPPSLLLVLALVLAAGWGALVSWPHLNGRAGPLDGLEAALTDLRLRLAGPIPGSSQVAIVAIDDAALMEGVLSYPMPRAELARLVRAIAAARPRVLAIDMVLTGEGLDDAGPGAPGTQALAEALEAVPAVLAVAGRFARGPAGPGPPVTQDELWPHPLLEAAAATGMVNLSADANGTPRHLPLLVLTRRGPVPALALRAAALHRGETPAFEMGAVRLGAGPGARRVPLDLGAALPLRLSGPPGTVPTLPARDVLEGRGLDALEGRTVLLGFEATAVGYMFVTPFAGRTPGVSILAGAVAQILGEARLVRSQALRRLDAGAALALALACTGLALALPLSAGAPLALGLLAAALAGSAALFAAGYWTSAALPLAAALPPAALAGAARHLLERARGRRAERTAQTLSAFQAPALAQRLAEDPDFLARPQTREAAILFVDVTGFTRLAQVLGPEGTQAYLKVAHAEIERHVEAAGGMVLNYMGDGAMCGFGLEGGDGATAALEAGFALAEHLPRLAGPMTGGRPAGVRIGLHVGPVLLSRLGGGRHQQITVTGDTVNLAARLMEVAKGEAAVLVASAALLAEAGPPPRPPDGRLLAPVRGRSGELDLAFWRAETLSGTPPEEATRPV
ncbi:MAG: adenylate/guanylate cyclase domain-containing protein [Pseudomonadota bacterium]